MLEPEIAIALEKVYGPVDATFTITHTPAGGAPLEIRRQWASVELPVRRLHVARFSHGYIGRRFMPLSEDDAVDALTGENPKWPVWGDVEVRGYDAVSSLRDLGRIAAAEFWTPYSEAMLGFNLSDGTFGKPE